MRGGKLTSGERMATNHSRTRFLSHKHFHYIGVIRLVQNLLGLFKTQVEPRAAGEWFHCQVLGSLWRRQFVVFYNNMEKIRAELTCRETRARQSERYPEKTDLVSARRHRFAGLPVVAPRNDVCFLRLSERILHHLRCV